MEELKKNIEKADQKIYLTLTPQGVTKVEFLLTMSTHFCTLKMDGKKDLYHQRGIVLFHRKFFKLKLQEK